MDNFKTIFPTLQYCTYLNTAYGGLLHTKLLDYRQEHDLDFLIHGGNQRAKQPTFLDGVRKTIAGFTKAKNGAIILSQNFSSGFRTLLSGIDNQKKILLVDLDYPSVNHTAISLGFDICYAKCDDKLEENIKIAVEKEQPDILAMSIVNYQNGICIDLDFVKKLKTAHPELLIIMDATQFIGTSNFDFDSSGIDILGASGYKWLLGGYGNGFFLFKKGLLDKYTPECYKKANKTTTYDASYTNLQARFEAGHLDYLNFGSLQQSMNYLLQLELPAIASKIATLSAYAKEQLAEKGLLEKIIMSRKNHSNIFTIQGDQKCYDTLTKNNIITARRGSGIRISLHFYNNKEDIDHLIRIIN